MTGKELKEGTTVFTWDGKEVGKVSRVILDPSTNEVTHIVVQKGMLLPTDKVVPIEMVRTATEEQVLLYENAGDVNQLPPFEESHFISTSAQDTNPAGRTSYPYAPAYYWYPPPAGILATQLMVWDMLPGHRSKPGAIFRRTPSHSKKERMSLALRASTWAISKACSLTQT